MFRAKQRRRRKLRQTPLPDEALTVISRNIPYYRHLPDRDRRELPGLVQVFLAEKSFEGCGGLIVSPEIRWTIAGLACLLLLRRETDFYPLLHSILVYPQTFVTERVEELDSGLVTEEVQELVGETWSQGSLVISWDDVLYDIAHHGEGYNVVLHEFAHQLDEESGLADGTPLLPEADLYPLWAEVFAREYGALRADLNAGRTTFLDEYGAESETEFFAVATETFFELPRQFRAEHPELYRLLASYYQQDPATWPLPAHDGRRY